MNSDQKNRAEVERLRTQHWQTVFAYSEWLDAEQDLVVDGDSRTHEDLVTEFMAQHHPSPESCQHRALFVETYQLLRRVERYGDWDAEYHADACGLYAKLGEHLWPDPRTTPS